VRAEFQLTDATPVVLYTGTFEAYQGLDLLFAAMALVASERPDARLIMAGGKPDQIARAREEARAAGVEAVTIFAGERPASEIPAFLLASNALVSPRSRGTNTPLKIYQYLRSGKPIVATQVLSDDTAILTGTTPREFADGILLALSDEARATSVSREARQLADTKYSYDAYLDRTRRACVALLPPDPPLTPVKDVA
jgi:glycosyltransferase involved in cell wall biosynthesis